MSTEPVRAVLCPSIEIPDWTDQRLAREAAFMALASRELEMHQDPDAAARIVAYLASRFGK